MPQKSPDHKKYSECLTGRVNELFHDLNYHNYDNDHPEIIKSEKKRWQIISQRFLSFSPKIILDFGTGTGFVPLAIKKSLKPRDKLICTDISKKILNQAEKNLSHLPVNKSFIKTSGYKLPFPNKTVDIVTINSVLHHLNKLSKYLKEMDRILKRGGLLIITHEPNAFFYRHKFLFWQFRILNKLVNINKIWGNLLNRPRSAAQTKKVCQIINRDLKKKGLIKNSLSQNEILKIVDIRDRDGINPHKLLPKYKKLDLKTYDHLHWVIKNRPKNPILKRYNQFLKKLFPKSGATFSIILKKPEK